MLQPQRLTTRNMLVLAHDVVAGIVAVVAAFYFRFEAEGLETRAHGLMLFLPAFAVYAAVVHLAFRTYRIKWRLTSLVDVLVLAQVTTVLALSLLVLDYVLASSTIYGTFFFGKITIVLFWFLQLFALTGGRVAYRYFRYRRTMLKANGGTVPVIIIGRSAEAEHLLRAIESGAVSRIRPVGILSPSSADQGYLIRGVAVVGEPDDLEQAIKAMAAHGHAVSRLILLPSALQPEARPEALLMRARRLHLATSRLPSLEQGGEALRLAPIEVEDLLLRPSANIDMALLEAFTRDKRVAVTGGGGSIGSEICDRIVTFGAAKLLIVENSEPALHAITEKLALYGSKVGIEGRLADIRDRARMFELLQGFKPDIVFHAAALKHVPLLERDWAEGIKTNVFGSVNVADAARASGATTMVMISTDKAIEPVSVLGVTKRIAEMYCQALDADLAAAGSEPMRLISVRFGNVLASNGSVVPKFKAQIEAGGPVTVTHPDMVRYFMTIREACDLVVTAASHAVHQERRDVSVYVLNMGQAVRIVELAERMIRLQGLEPGVDIDIVFTGVRPGERLHEILFAQDESSAEIGIPGILAAAPVRPSLADMQQWLLKLKDSLADEDSETTLALLRELVPGFRGEQDGSTAVTPREDDADDDSLRPSQVVRQVIARPV